MSAYSDQVLADGAVAYWRFNETSGSMVDQLGNNSFDTVTSATRGATGVLVDDTDKAVSFAGAGSLKRTGTPVGLPIGASARSFECWFKSADTNPQALLGYGDGTTDSKNQFVIALNDSSKGMVVSTWATGDVWFGTAAQWCDGAWHHAVVTYNGTTTCELYIDGTSQGTQSFNAQLNTANNNLVAGKLYYYDLGYFMNGTLDEMALYSSVLSASQVLNHYQLAHSFALAGSLSGTSTTSGQITAIVPVSAAISGSSSVAGGLNLTRGLVGSAIGSASSVAQTVITRALSGLSIGLATLTGLLRTNSTLPPANGSVVISSSQSVVTLAQSVITPTITVTSAGSVSVSAEELA